MLKPIPLHHADSTSIFNLFDDETASAVADEAADAERARREAQWRASVNLLASTLGTGLLCMPGACHLAGIPLFILASAMAAHACNLTACYLVETVKYLAPRSNGSGTSEGSTYAGLASQVYGKRGEKIIEIGLVFQQFGACVGYIIVIGDIFYPLLHFYFGEAMPVGESAVRNLFLWLLMFPLTIGVKNLSGLSFASTLAVGAICLFACTVIGNALYITLVPGGEEKRIQLEPISAISAVRWVPEDIMAIVRTIPLVCFAYDMHFNAIPVHEDMKLDILSSQHSSVDVFRRASKLAFQLTFVVTTLTGVAGYITFLDYTHSDILRNFAVSATYIAPYMNIVRALFGLGLSLAFPMIVWELRQVLMILCNGNGERTQAFYVITVAIFLLVALLVTLVENATTVFSFVGSTVTPTLDYIFPALLYIRSGAAERAGEYYMPRVLLVSGTGIFIVSLSTWIGDRI